MEDSSFVCMCRFNYISKIVTAQNYGGKLIQRSTTYFQLCNLYHEMEYDFDYIGHYEKYANELQEILKNDNSMSLSNAFIMSALLKGKCARELEKEAKLYEEGKNKIK